MAKKRTRNVTFRGMLANGVHQAELDVAVSQEIGHDVRAVLGNCYKNAFLALGSFSGEQVWYVEGYADVHGVPLAHGWLVADGKAIDPTVAAMDGSYPSRYTPVLAWTARDAVEQASEQMVMPLGDYFCCPWQGGTLTPEQVGRAWQSAMLSTAGYTGTLDDFYGAAGLAAAMIEAQ